ncbi:hypothetical protein BV25DRAFT_1922482 [Artomyces pyxidatus]|uniref:Uncharacterized protein n=1 Tax=Artomyces pyxidatus TaxID=48021 RepID=A0ACB8SDR1_9AGAM|nr:hypothetical protein BV25DRAFT_1922482 [Artomyces pyxidatus]
MFEPEGETMKPLSPYDGLGNRTPPVPAHLLGVIQASWLMTDIQQGEPLSLYPYALEEPSRGVRGKTVYVGRVRNALFRGDAPPEVNNSLVYGDVWIKTGSPVSISIFSCRGDVKLWINWPGNGDTHRVAHPLLPQRRLWFSFTNASWINVSGLPSNRSHWRRSPESIAWMQQRGRLHPSGEAMEASVEDLVALGYHSSSQRRAFIKEMKNQNTETSQATALKRRKLEGGAEQVQIQSSQPHSNLSLVAFESPTSSSAPLDDRASPPAVDAEEYHIRLDDEPSASGQRHHAVGDGHPLVTVTESSSTLSIPASKLRTIGRFWNERATISAGRQWPEYAESVTWRNELTTVLPYVGIPFKTPDPDVDAVRQMASGWDATQGDHNHATPVIFLQWDESKLAEIQSQISDALSNNITVVVEGWTFEGPPIRYDEEGFTKLRGSLLAPIQYHCATARFRDNSDEPEPGLSNLSNRFYRSDKPNLSGLFSQLGISDSSDSCSDLSDLTDSDEGSDVSEGDFELEDDGLPEDTSGGLIGDTVGNFLRLSKYPKFCGNLMDSPQVDGRGPPFVEAISDDVWAWLVTSREGYERAGLRLQAEVDIEATRLVQAANGKKKKKKKGSATELTNEILQQARENVMEKAREAERDPEVGAAGPRMVPVDAFQYRHWDLMTTAGYYTWHHHDANGLCTWAAVRDGCKFWALVRFRPSSVASRKDVASMIKLFETMTSGERSQVVATEDFEAFVVVLEPGSTIIMPPGAWHEVYTPINTIISGGHFLQYNTFHLTQWSRLFDASNAEATNADHVGMRRTIARMTLALKYLTRPLKMRPFLALAAMVLNEAKYVALDPDSEPPGARYEDDVEMVMAFRIIKTVCHANGISRADVERLSLLTGQDWDNPGSDLINLGSAAALISNPYLLVEQGKKLKGRRGKRRPRTTYTGGW